MFRPAPTQGPFGRDFEAYYAAGATWDSGGDPWSRAVWQVERTVAGVDPSRGELLPYVGPAAALPLFGMLARLPHPIALRIWSGLLAAACVALGVAALRLTGTRRTSAWFGVLLVIFAAGPTISDIALGQLALCAVAGTVWALVLYERRAGGFAGTAAVLATLAAGFQPNVSLALIARLRDAYAVRCAALAAAVFGALTLAAGGGAAGVVRYVERLAAHGRAERFSAIQHTPAAIAYACGAAPSAASAIGAAVALTVLAAAVIAIVRLRLDARDGTLLALAALPLVVPFFHEHDFVLELIPVLVLALRAEGAARAAAAAGAALVLVDWFGLAQRQSAGPQILALGFAAMCGFVVLRDRPRLRRTDLVPFAALALLACGAVPLARAYPAPTWPDALPARYQPPPHADASAVWADEQRAAGLDARVAAWGALRALPLAGSVLTGAGIALYAGRRARCRRS